MDCKNARIYTENFCFERGSLSVENGRFVRVLGAEIAAARMASLSSGDISCSVKERTDLRAWMVSSTVFMATVSLLFLYLCGFFQSKLP